MFNFCFHLDVSFNSYSNFKILIEDLKYNSVQIQFELQISIRSLNSES